MAVGPTLTPAEFALRWKGNTQTERAVAQSHFIDLCRMLDVPAPTDDDPRGETYAFEKGAEKTGEGDGFADVWKRHHFAWEYKKKRENLDKAYAQLLKYREALENPPLLVVCDLNRFRVHTNFTNTTKKVYEFTLADLESNPREPLRILRAVMSDPFALRPGQTREELTEQAAGDFAHLAQALRARGHDPQRVAHFLNKLLFCMFAEDAGLLPPDLLKRVIEGTASDPSRLTESLAALFAMMSEHGGLFGPEPIQWFNGGLFDGSDVLPLERPDIDVIRGVSRLDWSQVEPAIFGTLFERGLDPGKRSQLGAHYTDRSSIERVIDPVVIVPLRREFATMQEEILAMSDKDRTVVRTRDQRVRLRDGRERLEKRGSLNMASPAYQRYRAFLDRLKTVRVLDPACGSGNFLYTALQALKDLEKQVNLWAATTLGVPVALPQISPEAVSGIELNPYAAELARVSIWIGEIQWMIDNGYAYLRHPILRPLDHIECRDAVLDHDTEGRAMEPTWPAAEFIIGNPPFLGAKLLRQHLESAYVEELFAVYGDRLPGMSDLVCYWFEKARAMIEAGNAKRAGLLATQGIRGQYSRRVLERIKETGDIFMAWSDEPWVLEGAAVHVSIVGFDNGDDKDRVLDEKPVVAITANLRGDLDFTRARPLAANVGLGFYADIKGGPFDVTAEVARRLIASPNPHGHSNAEVVRPWTNGLDVTRRPRDMWVIDFGVETPIEWAALYEAPFEYVKTHVEPFRRNVRRQRYRERWWLHVEPCTGMRHALAPLSRYIATPATAKHRLFAWMDSRVLPDHALVVFAREDDYFFGVLHSRPHELWARAMGTQLREVESGFRYTPTTTFETFPFPEPTQEQREATAAAAQALDTFRRGWLNPSGVSPSDLNTRTLTNLYNERPTWLAQCHDRLDQAVHAAYGWQYPLSDDQVLSRLLELNLSRNG